MPNNDSDDQTLQAVIGEMKLMRQGMRRVFFSLALLTAMVILLAAAVFGSLVNYFGGDVLLFGAAGAAAGVIGFLCGWIARHRCY